MATSNTFGPLTPAAEIAEAFPDSVQGKTIIVTGVSPKSLGLATASAFASQSPANLIVTGRSADKVETSINDLKANYPNVKCHALIMDLASQSSVRAAAAKINEDESIQSIDIVVNNAGVMAIQTPTLSEDGIETSFATNHIGHFLFTNLILPKIIKAAQTSSTPTRIVNERPDFQKTEFLTGSSHAEDIYYGFFSYAQSKTANILYSISLNQKLWEKYGVASFAVHPGAVNTNINRHATPSEIEQALKRVKELGFDSSQKITEQGANTSVFAAIDPNLPPVNFSEAQVKGVYLADCKVDDGNAAAFATNRAFAERLWTLSENLVGQKFGF
ncbi:unnamed protein product [Penicillium salamii]|uniref:NAD(P)-binding protein n=1 Tax=Penicillium salamii TaxID=1612424 RepID=A0A9W4JJG8_9EURO|nr:unnamed protein product [Penicillium salamii]